MGSFPVNPEKEAQLAQRMTALGVSEADIARDVFGFSFWLQSQKARLIVRSHMRRAHWLAENVFSLLGW